MRKNRYFVQIVAISFLTFFGCAKEAQVESAEEPSLQTDVQEGHYMTLSLNLPAETKMTHELDGTTVKTKWEVGDCIRVYNRDTQNNNDGFWTILQAEDIAVNGKSATFTSTNTSVTESTAINIYYHSNFKGATSSSQLASNLNFSDTQNGSIESLPEYLSAINVKIQDGGIALSPSLTRFHFHFDQSTNPGMVIQDGTFSSVTLKKVWGTAVLGNQFNLIHGGGSADYTEGEITVEPATPFVVSKDGEWSIDFYIAAYISQSTDALFCLTFNPSDPSGISYEYNWYPTKTYSTTKVYKASPKFNGFKIPQGKRLTLNYTTTNASPAGYYSYWRMLMYNGTESGHFSDLRCDYWNNMTNRDYMFSTDNFTNYHTILNGGTTVMTIDNSANGYTYVQSTSSHAGVTEEVYSQTYAHATSSYVRVKLLPDGSTITMNSAALVDIPTNEDVVSVSSSFTSKYEGVAEKICLNPAFIPVTATYADSHVSTVSDGYGQYQILPTDGIINYNENAVIHFRGNGAITGNIPVATSSNVLNVNSLSEKTTGYTEHTTYRWSVPANCSQTIGMRVETDITQAVEHPGVILLKSNSATVGNGDEGNSYGFYRIDGWYRDDRVSPSNFATPPTATFDGFGENDVFATEKSNLDGCTIYVTVSNNGTGSASIRYYMIGSDSNIYKIFFNSIPVNTGTIYFCLATEYNKLYFTNE